MGNRGRTAAAASLAIVPPGELVTSIKRPPAPPELTHEQAEEWRAVVDRMPAEWFTRETHGMLAQYCRHVVSARRVGQLIESMDQGSEEFDLAKYDLLLKMQEREGRALSSLATRMRISQHSSYDKKKTKGTTAKRPWD